MAGPSRMDRLIAVLGGEKNLPPQQPQPIENAQQANNTANENTSPTEDPFSKLPSVDDVLQDNHSTENWWDAKPQIQQPVSLSQSQGPAAIPFTSEGAGHFEFDPRKGEPAPLGINFTPFGAVTKFCYKFVKRELQQPLATAFFDEGKIWNREWDIYYIWSDYYQTAKPITFVPEYQLQALVDQINESFPAANITITEELREEGLVIDFDDIERVELRPRFLGHSTSRSQIEYWTDNLPFPLQVEGMMATNDRTLAAFQAKMELAIDVAKNKKKAAGKKRQAENLVKRQSMVRMLLRAQRYLGMLAKSDESQLLDMSKLSLTPTDVQQTAPHPFDSDVIFIAVDIEAYERPPHPITEVGIATLDTRDLLGRIPGVVAEDWQKAIRARHFRIAEYKNLVNREFVEGCPDKFEFGESELVGGDKISQTIASCFKEPYSGSGSIDSQGTKRNVVLVGHDISQDINYLRKLGYNVSNCGNIIDTMDTATLTRAYTHDPNARSLGSVLYEFELMGWNLHNAGNDAVYTLRALLAICTKAASERGSAEAAQKHGENLEKKTEIAVELAKERVKDESEGWESPGDDGGVAVPLADTYGPHNKKDKDKGEPNRQLYTVGGSILDV